MEQPVLEAALQSSPDGEKILNDIDAYKTIQESIPANIPMSEETRAAVTGKMLQRAKLKKEIDQLSTYGTSFNDKIEDLEKQVGGVEADINAMSKSNNPFLHETDNATGERLAPVKSYEDLSGKEKSGIVVPKEYGKAEVKKVVKERIKLSVLMQQSACKKRRLSPVKQDTRRCQWINLQ
jgi:outer membrane murein-binding lipoprotein Lpp